MINRDLPSNKRPYRFFELRAHTYRKVLHGRDFSFEYPIFSTDLLGPRSETGLFVSARDESNVDAYIFIDQQTLKVMMDEEGDGPDVHADKIIDFANRNMSMMRKLVIDLNNTSKREEEFVAEMDTVEATTSKGRAVRVYRFPTVEYDHTPRLTR
jgi:hypothetical protein